ncbi:hypothetical protein [Vibrio fluvialis]|uniref:hypothetical protein n=1 Tax=Vibrio fluvialis TaxID=676 RepID=UPI001F47744F|nr:hypothetical protein [Vibrio fluvialis]MCE7646795.1 hypothetical protein [Vibrio fluvialis]
MAPKVPQTADKEIFEKLNESLSTGSQISLLEIQRLINKASKIPVPQRYACLAAVYSHVPNYDLTLENAEYAVKYSCGDKECIMNALSSLNNLRCYSDIVRFARTYPAILRCNDVIQECYDAAFYSFDFDFCEELARDYMDLLNEALEHRNLINFFDSDPELINKASEYISFSLRKFKDISQKHQIRTSSNTFGFNAPSHKLGAKEFNFIIGFKSIDIDRLIDIETEWLKGIAEYEISDERLCAITFSMEAL